MIWEQWNKHKPMAQPFNHDDLELKQQFIEVARDMYRDRGNSLEKQLGAALLYMNVADYLAEYLVVGLTEMAKEAVSRYYLGLISMQPPKRDKLNIGDSIYHLKRFDFPKKEQIIEELTAVNDARNKVAHQILKTQRQKLTELDTAMASLVEHTEALVVLIDEISMGLPPPNLMEKLVDLTLKQDSSSHPKTEKTSGKGV